MMKIRCLPEPPSRNLLVESIFYASCLLKRIGAWSTQRKRYRMQMPKRRNSKSKHTQTSTGKARKVQSNCKQAGKVLSISTINSKPCKSKSDTSLVLTIVPARERDSRHTIKIAMFVVGFVLVLEVPISLQTYQVDGKIGNRVLGLCPSELMDIQHFFHIQRLDS